MVRGVAAALAIAASGSAFAEEQWKTVSTEPFPIKSRDVNGSSVKEIWAEGEIAAPAQDIQSTLLDADRFRDFMPYVKESRTLGKPGGDGGQIVYTRLDFGAWVSSRDYVVKVFVERSVASDGSGEFRNRWVALPDHLPSRSNIVRVRVNEGSWHVTPRGPNKSYVVYRFMVDPGGWIPSFAANAGNKQAVTATFQAVEREAQRRAETRRNSTHAAAAAPAPSGTGGSGTAGK